MGWGWAVSRVEPGVIRQAAKCPGKEEGKTTFEKGGLARKNLMQMPTEFDNDASRSIF